METNLDLFGNPLLTPLVYRKFQKSAVKPQPQNVYIEPGLSYERAKYISIKASSICQYSRPLNKDISIRAVEGNGLPQDRRAHGLISTKANKSIHNIIDWMLLSTKLKETTNPRFNSKYQFKINFVTLSLPAKQMHSDKYLQTNLFAPFLDWVRKTNHATGLDSLEFDNCKMYFWRSEAQANGNIHWHLCTDVFIPYKTIQGKWNHLLKKLDYIDLFEQIHGHRSPNSTDVHSVKNVRNIAKYLSKYCGKNSKGITMLLTKTSYLQANKPFFLPLKNAKPKQFVTNKGWHFPLKKAKFYRQIYSRLWSCSENLSRLKICKKLLSEEMEKELYNFKNNYPHRVRTIDFATLYRVPAIELKDLQMFYIRQVLVAHYLANVSLN